MRVLMVEDDPLMTEILTVGMQSSGIEPVVCGTTEQAQAQLADATRFDAVVSDVDLGAGGSGLDLAAYCLAAFPGLRVILLSGHTRRRFEDQLGELPNVTYIQKPVSIDSLTKVIAEPTATAAPSMPLAC